MRELLWSSTFRRALRRLLKRQPIFAVTSRQPYVFCKQTPSQPRSYAPVAIHR